MTWIVEHGKNGTPMYSNGWFGKARSWGWMERGTA